MKTYAEFVEWHRKTHPEYQAPSESDALEMARQNQTTEWDIVSQCYHEMYREFAIYGTE